MNQLTTDNDWVRPFCTKSKILAKEGKKKKHATKLFEWARTCGSCDFPKSDIVRHQPKAGLIDPHVMSSQCLRNNNKSKCCLSVFIVLRHSELDSESHYRHNYAIAGQARNDDKYSEFTCFGLSSLLGLFGAAWKRGFPPPYGLGSLRSHGALPKIRTIWLANAVRVGVSLVLSCRYKKVRKGKILNSPLA